MTKRVYLYAFNGMARVVGVRYLDEEKATVLNVLRLGLMMKDTHPDRVTVYAIMNRPGLYADFMESVKSSDFTKHIEFRDQISRAGLKII